MLEFLEGRFQFLAINAADGNAVKPYPLVDDLVRPVLQVAVSRLALVMVPAASAEDLKPCPRKITRLGPNGFRPFLFKFGTAHMRHGQSRRAWKVLHCFMSPASMPRLNQRTRSADVPCVNVSGTA